MDEAGQLYALGLWTAKPGNEDAFRDAWAAFARWTSANAPGSGEAYLLQDVDNPRRFISFGPWADAESVAAWRQRPEFKAFFIQAKALCEEIQPRTLKAVVHAGAG